MTKRYYTGWDPDVIASSVKKPITLRWFSHLLGYTIHHATNLVAAGSIKVIQVGGLRMVYPDEVHRYVRELKQSLNLPDLTVGGKVKLKLRTKRKKLEIHLPSSFSKL